MSASPIKAITQRGDGQSARKRYVIAMREPWNLPEEKVELPSPEPLKNQPPTLNLISALLPPVMMMIVVFIYSRLSPTADMRLMILMPMMSMAFPIGNIISYQFQKREYKKALALREQNYRNALAKSREKLDGFAQEQRKVFETEYPVTPKLLPLALGQASRRRLWWRRPSDSDFLSLRMGTGNAPPSFSVTMPRLNDANEPLMSMAQEIVESYHVVSKLPILLNLQEAGSVAVTGKSETNTLNLVRRLLLDVIAHHSPQDVQVAVISDLRDANERWGWLKWEPHTHAILPGEGVRRLAFTPSSIDKYLEWLVSEYNQRTKTESGIKRSNESKQAFVVVLDDSGDLRQSREIKQLAASGYEADIFLVFAGGKYFPRECRARIDISGNDFSYMETWAGEKGGKRLQGMIDPATIQDCERFARGVASLEVSSGLGEGVLPESVRLFDLLDAPQLSGDLIKQSWQRLRSDDEYLRFPFGFRMGRKGLENVELNLLPEDLGGTGSYHTILVGTTGSGKSEFMKSLVLSAAFRYSPRDLNFFFMDFKGGAAFNVLKDLPHVVGVVTNLSPHLVERGLSAMEAEIERRQKCFADAAVQNIWAYNAKYSDKPMSQLLLLLDEFARGIEEFPRLPDMLDRLVRQGRSLGMYLLLANQDVNSAVDKLLNNVGWKIALKVARPDEMHIVNRSLPIPKRSGQGYLASAISDPVEFQAAYSGFSIREQEEDVQEAFKIFQIEQDGRWQLIHTSARKEKTSEIKRPKEVEQDHLIAVMKPIALETGSARQIYLDPLEEKISLEQVFVESAVQRIFDGAWNPEKKYTNRLITPIGFIDSPKECLQEELEIDFDDQDGHLWIVGAPGSGKAMTLESILLSLALTHTPNEAWFYIFEYGAGQLLKFESLPHTGAVLRSTDPDEKLDKLLNFFDQEMDRRMERQEDYQDGNGSEPAIFLIINNFAEMRTNYPDQADRLSRYARDGKAMGLHLIITTNRRVELSRILIARKIVLRLSNRDEYMDVVGRTMSIPPALAEGRGLWIVDQRIVECQIAQPMIRLPGGESDVDPRLVIQGMDREWQGPRARKIGILPTVIPLDDLLDQVKELKSKDLPVPIGVSYESQDLVAPRLLKEFPRWLVLGPPRSGKTNFLASLSKAVSTLDSANWRIYYFMLRRTPPDWFNNDHLELIREPQNIVKTLNHLTELILGNTGEPHLKSLLLFDDLGGAFEQGKDMVAAALNNFASQTSTRDDIFIVASGIREELQSHQIGSLFVKNLKLGKTGLCLSKDSNDLDWYGATSPMQYRRLTFTPGRGFWVSGGKMTFLQSPIFNSEIGDL